MTDIKLTKENGGPLTHRPEVYFPTFAFGANPFGLMKRFTEEVDRTLAAYNPTPDVELWAPPLEVKHKAGNFVVTVELPGIPKEEVKVEVIDEALVIEGERKLVKEVKEEGFFRSERTYGKFYRTIPLPKGAKADEIKADLTNGVLEVTIPVPEMKPLLRHIPIKTAGK